LTGVVVGCDDRNIEHILSSNFGNYRKGEFFTINMKEFFGRSIVAVDGDEWRFQRKIASPVFTSRSIKNDMTAVFVKNAELMIDKLNSYAETGEVFDMQDLYHKYTLESFAEIAFGEKQGLLTTSDEHTAEWTKSFDIVPSLCLQRLGQPFW
jgi:cytochrome P450